MFITRIFRNKVFMVASLMLGIIGGILFLPLQLNHQYTRFYHRIFNKEQPVNNTRFSDQVTDANIQDHKSIHSGHGQDLLKIYLRNYALLWWVSMGLAAYFIYSLKNTFKGQQNAC